MLRIKLSGRWMVVMLALNVVSAAFAAPTTEQPAAALPDQLQAVPGANPRARTGAQASTVELLVEMQPKSPGADFTERAASRGNKGTSQDGALLLKAELLETRDRSAPTKGGLFGAGATPTVAIKQMSGGAAASVDVAREVHRTAVDAEPGAAVGSMSTDSGSPTPALPVIRWLRDNRVTIGLSAATGLALLWGGSLVAARRRH